MTSPQIVYFHGQPGSPAELTWALDGATPAGLFAPDRARARPDLTFADYVDWLAEAITAQFPAGLLNLIGFSLGGVIAMETALRLAQRDVALDLIATPAPLSIGDFLPQMAGGVVFRLARDQPAVFSALTAAQGLIARWAPSILFGQMFASVSGGDSELTRDAEFKGRLEGILAHALGGGAPGYRREIGGFVTLAPVRLLGLQAPVRLWQGEADTWTPPAMASALEALLPRAGSARTFPGLSHYSTLKVALPEIIRLCGPSALA